MFLMEWIFGNTILPICQVKKNAFVLVLGRLGLFSSILPIKLRMKIGCENAGGERIPSRRWSIAW